jgi:hypothetical protein
MEIMDGTSEVNQAEFVRGCRSALLFRTRGKTTAGGHRASSLGRISGSQHRNLRPGQRPGDLSPSRQGLKETKESRVVSSPSPSSPKGGDESPAREDQRATQGRAHEHASPRIGIAVPNQWPRVTGPAARNISIEVEEEWRNFRREDGV